MGLARGFGASNLMINIFDALAFFYRESKNAIFFLPMGRGKTIFYCSDQDHSPEATAISAASAVSNDNIPDILSAVDADRPCLYHSSLEEYFSEYSQASKLIDNLATAIAAFASSPAVKTSAPVFVSSTPMQ
jgi:hypothetical protein